MSGRATLSVKGLVIGGAPIEFEVRPGEILAVLGDNGAGKSLLLACLTGHLRTPEGSVRLGQADLRTAHEAVGVVFQHPGLIRNMTVFENVALPFLVHGLKVDSEWKGQVGQRWAGVPPAAAEPELDGELESQIRLRLKLVGCEDLADEAVHRLSEGDKRCVALARALSGRTRLLIADEPVAALSPAKKILVQELLMTLVRTGALTNIVLATQDIDFAQGIATHFLLLRCGGCTLIHRGDAAKDEYYNAFINQAAA